MKKIKNILVLILVTSICFTSCDDYLDVNDSIDNPNLSELNPNQLIVGAQSRSAETYTNRVNRIGNWMGVAWSGNYLAFNDAYGPESRYQFSTTFYNDVWDNLYRFTSNFATIENYEDGRNWNNQKAAAKILKTFYFQYIVDLYGDAPYTEAFQGSDFLFPTYDDAQDIYIDLINTLDEAIALINSGTDLEPFGSSDITFNGDMDKWLAFANTVKLRLLVRLILKAETDSELLTFVNSKFTDLNTATFIDEDVVINPGYTNSDDRQNPFWEVYGANPVGVLTNQGRQTGPSLFAFNLLTNSNDERLNRIWKTNPDSGVFAGTPQNGNGNSAAIGDGILKGPDADLPIMLSSESYFLQAEAIQRGYLNGNAQSMFNMGIQSSYDFLGAGDASSYISDNDTDIDLGFNGGNPLRAILTQKWIALTSVSGAELWIEYNRTGYPSNLPLPENSTDTNIPLRLLYPASEYSGNSNNVINQTRSDAFTSKIFWDVN
ncbi:SusD-like starch-binding protein associating with outer membrane [Winogradskyella wandonensis]|uniref:SusD-like starch-binding protein associating with outer membrane n=1 Tax=Winogradskyella wandonensis TaxID=1442586 RepID=A0A4R1KTT5_9FLAO|nr:SusD/RagB family nutrient-binding outer membrane lipoprotein [Winogradskyella wandonensis]TCK68564.1 SusD-like starch-binding protein associating with outer membrane [Winogradskyella wandonensis]